MFFVESRMICFFVESRMLTLHCIALSVSVSANDHRRIGTNNECIAALSPIVSRVRSVTISLFWSRQKLLSFLDEEARKSRRPQQSSSRVSSQAVKHFDTSEQRDSVGVCVCRAQTLNTGRSGIFLLHFCRGF